MAALSLFEIVIGSVIVGVVWSEFVSGVTDCWPVLPRLSHDLCDSILSSPINHDLS
jgi:hypothetical protein